MKTMKNLFFLALTMGGAMVACHKETKAEQYAREAQETTRSCPVAIDANTIMDSMTYSRKEHCFTYYYTVVELADSVLVANQEMYRQSIYNLLINTPDLRPYMEDSMAFRYVYRTSTSKDEVPLMDFLYTPDMY